MVSSIVSRLGNAPEEGIKAPCRVATTANITLSGHQTINGVLTTDNDRVLVKDQTLLPENGIYIASQNAWERAPDFEKADDVFNGVLVVDEETRLLYQIDYVGLTYDPGVSDVTFTLFAPGGTISGSITDNQVAVGAATADDIEGSGALTFDSALVQLKMDGDLPRFDTNYSTGALDAKYWRFSWGTSFTGRIFDDAVANFYDWLDIVRSGTGAGVQVDTIAFTAASNLTINSNLVITDAAPQFIVIESDAVLDEKRWDVVAVSGQLRYRIVNDANSAGVDYMLVDRTANVLDGVTFPTDVSVTGALTTSASTITRAGLNIPEGTAPTTPADGDVWVTAAGAFNARLNGVTVDLASSGGGVAGSDTQVQFNNAGSFGASSNLTWNDNTLTVTSSAADAVYGSTTNASSAGVYGLSPATTVAGNGVRGARQGTGTGAGVLGEALADSGQYGVHGIARASATTVKTGYGVVAEHQEDGGIPLRIIPDTADTEPLTTSIAAGSIFIPNGGNEAMIYLDGRWADLAKRELLNVSPNIAAYDLVGNGSLNLPTGCVRVVIHFYDLGTNGTSPMIWQLEDSTSLKTSLYQSKGYQNTTHYGTSGSANDGFRLHNTNASGRFCTGFIILQRRSTTSNVWMASWQTTSSNSSNATYGNGNIFMSGDLTDIRLTTQGGTDSFNAGQLTVHAERF